jgi:hypothetical protein
VQCNRLRREKDDSPLTCQTRTIQSASRLSNLPVSRLIRTESASEAKPQEHSLPTGKSNSFLLGCYGHVTRLRGPVSSADKHRTCAECGSHLGWLKLSTTFPFSLKWRRMAQQKKCNSKLVHVLNFSCDPAQTATTHKKSVGEQLVR